MRLSVWSCFAVLLLTADNAWAGLLFYEPFNTLDAWTGKNGGAFSGQIVPDPLDSTNDVVRFASMTTRGDIFSPEIEVFPGVPYILEFDYLGIPGLGMPDNLGGYIGIADDTSFPGGQHVWLEGTGQDGVNDPTLIDDGNWSSYLVEFDPFDATQLALPDGTHPFAPISNTIRIIMEDFADGIGVPGDVFFDNVSLSTNFRIARPEVDGDFNSNSVLDANDIDLLSYQLRSDLDDQWFDLDGDNVVTELDKHVWITNLANTAIGDANLDGVFNSTDLVSIFQAAEYEDEFRRNSTWATGDWNGDAEFDSADFIAAFEEGGYDLNVEAFLVPESSGAPLLLMVIFLCQKSVVRRPKNLNWQEQFPSRPK